MLNSRTRLMNACKGNPVDRTPVWFMRQAGRIFQEYRDIREDYEFLTVCETPELNAKVTTMPVKKLNVDAAILFADIMLPLTGMGANYRFESGVGPVVEDPIEGPDDVERIRTGRPKQDLSFLANSIEAVLDELPDDVPLVGFAGAPFTLASYLIEGRSPSEFQATKKFFYKYPDSWHKLMQHLVKTTVKYFKYQVKSGVEIIQLFDSWVGQLSPYAYERFVQPHTRRIFSKFSNTDVPTIHFGTQTSGILSLIDETEPDVISVDWRITLSDAQDQISDTRPLQGNLDPSVLLGSPEAVERETERILTEAGQIYSHIFNVGHGFLPQTPIDNIKQVIEQVKKFSSD